MVDGNTLLYATVGDPVAQIRAPQVMGAVFEKLAVNGVWVPMHVDQAGLLAVLQGLRTVRNFRAITVTIPHKQTVVAMLDRLSVAAQASGGVNMVRLDNDGKLFGDMVDGSGFVRGLELHGHHVQGAAVWLIGLGGGGSAIAAALAEARVARLYLTEMNRERGRAAPLRSCNPVERDGNLRHHHEAQGDGSHQSGGKPRNARASRSSHAGQPDSHVLAIRKHPVFQ